MAINSRGVWSAEFALFDVLMNYSMARGSDQRDRSELRFARINDGDRQGLKRSKSGSDGCSLNALSLRVLSLVEIDARKVRALFKRRRRVSER